MVLLDYIVHSILGFVFPAQSISNDCCFLTFSFLPHFLWFLRLYTPSRFIQPLWFTMISFELIARMAQTSPIYPNEMGKYFILYFIGDRDHKV